MASRLFEGCITFRRLGHATPALRCVCILPDLWAILLLQLTCRPS